MYSRTHCCQLVFKRVLIVLLCCLTAYGAPRRIQPSSLKNQETIKGNSMMEKHDGLLAWLGIYERTKPTIVRQQKKHIPNLKGGIKGSTESVPMSNSFIPDILIPTLPNQLPSISKQEPLVERSTGKLHLATVPSFKSHQFLPIQSLEKEQDYIQDPKAIPHKKFDITHSPNINSVHPSIQVGGERMSQSRQISKNGKGQELLKHTKLSHSFIRSTHGGKVNSLGGLNLNPNALSRPMHLANNRPGFTQWRVLPGYQSYNEHSRYIARRNWNYETMQRKQWGKEDLKSSVESTNSQFQSPMGTRSVPVGFRYLRDTEYWMKLPKAIVFPGGKCKLSKNEGENQARIGQCRPLNIPCNIGEAPQTCSSLFKCCVTAANKTESVEKRGDQWKLSSTEGKQKPLSLTAVSPSGIQWQMPARGTEQKPLPLATVFPRGMCRAPKENGFRIGSCLPAHFGCKVIQYKRASRTRAQSVLEEVAYCGRSHQFGYEMFCCASKIETSLLGQGSSLDGRETEISPGRGNSLYGEETEASPMRQGTSLDGRAVKVYFNDSKIATEITDSGKEDSPKEQAILPNVELL